MFTKNIGKKLSLYMAILYMFVFCGLVHSDSKKTIRLDKLVEYKWFKVTTKNFEITTNDSPKKIEQLVTDLEEFRYFVAKVLGFKQVEGLPPVRLLILKDKKSFDYLKFKDVDGIFAQSLDGFVSVANGDSMKSSNRLLSRGRQTIYHEMVHYFMSNRANQIQEPLWYTEGIAEYLSTIRRSKKKITFGQIGLMKNSLEWLRSSNDQKYTSIEVEDLFRASSRSKESSNSENRQQIDRIRFYARAFVTVHYFNASKVRRSQLRKYLALIDYGLSVDDAFSKAFDVSFKELNKEINRYLSDGKMLARSFKVGESAFEFPKFSPNVEVLSNSDAIHNVLEIVFLFHGGGWSEKYDLSAVLNQYKDRFPSDQRYQFLSAKYDSSVSRDDKLALLLAFVEGKPKNSKANALIGDIYLKKSHVERRRGNESWMKTIRTARSFFRKAIDENIFSGRAHYGLAKTYRHTPYSEATIDEGIMGYQVARLFIERSWALPREAFLNLLVGDYVLAEKSLSRYINRNNGRWAKGVLTWNRDALKLLRIHSLGVTQAEDAQIDYVDGSIYRGDVNDGIPSGSGRLVLRNGAKYEGVWSDGLPHGQGKFTASNGMVYQGNFDKGVVNGVGKLAYTASSNLDYYEGEFYRYMLHGEGKVVYSDGRVATVAQHRGISHGDGILQLASGEKIQKTWIWGNVVSKLDDGVQFIGGYNKETGMASGSGECSKGDAYYSCKIWGDGKATESDN